MGLDCTCTQLALIDVGLILVAVDVLVAEL